MLALQQFGNLVRSAAHKSISLYVCTDSFSGPTCWGSFKFICQLSSTRKEGSKSKTSLMPYPIATAGHGSCHSYSKIIGLSLPDFLLTSRKVRKLQEAGQGSFRLKGVVFLSLMGGSLNQRAANLGFCSALESMPISTGRGCLCLGTCSGWLQTCRSPGLKLGSHRIRTWLPIAGERSKAGQAHIRVLVLSSFTGHLIKPQALGSSFVACLAFSVWGIWSLPYFYAEGKMGEVVHFSFAFFLPPLADLAK